MTQLDTMIKPSAMERRMIYAVWDGICAGESEEDLVIFANLYSGSRIRWSMRAIVIRNIRRHFATQKIPAPAATDDGDK